MMKWFSLQGIEKKLFFGYFLFSLLLFFYSFTQVDLGLTLTKASFITDIQKAFQYIGYFNRPLSALIFLILLAGFFALYAVTIHAVMKNKITFGGFWKILSLVTIILIFSYPAFSHDIFNYIFDAKIVTYYQQNPYEHKALDYPSDPMLSFMHWTHRTYPYGPIWLFITIPFSFLGLFIFPLTLLLFKVVGALSYLLSIFAISKIARKVTPDNSLLPVVLFALNPLVLFEILVTGHNDLWMMSFSLLGLLFLLNKKYISSVFFLLLSTGVKFATLVLLPLFLLWPLLQKKINKNKGEVLVVFSFLFMMIGVGIATYRTNFQPWYFLFLLPFASLLQGKYIAMPIGIVSFTGLLLYVPYLFLGNWDPPVPMILNTLTITGVIIGVTTYVYLRLRVKR